jgi:methyl-accepting chemotaxis protein
MSIADGNPGAASQDALARLVVEEWGDDGRAAWDAAAGDHETLITQLSERTGRTRALLRRQLAELNELSREGGDSATPHRARATSAAADGVAQAAASLSELGRRVEAAVREVEGRAQAALGEVTDTRLPQAEAKIRENLLTSLLMSLGFGLLVGIIVGGSLGRGR